MNCPRCRGLMVAAALTDLGHSTDSQAGWQCLMCGEVTDAIISANRKHRIEPRRNRARPPVSLPAASAGGRRKRTGT